MDMMEDASGSRVAVAEGNRGPERWPGAVVLEFQRRVAAAQNWLEEGRSAVARFGQAVEKRRGMARRGRVVQEKQLLWEKKVWMAVSRFGAQVEAQVQRTMVEVPEAMVRMVRSRGGAPRPLMAALSLGLPMQGEGVEGKHVFDIAMSAEQVAKRLDGVPVYTVSNSSNEFVLVSDLNTSKSLGIFCFRESDAEALLSQVVAVKVFVVIRHFDINHLLDWHFCRPLRYQRLDAD